MNFACFYNFFHYERSFLAKGLQESTEFQQNQNAVQLFQEQKVRREGEQVEQPQLVSLVLMKMW